MPEVRCRESVEPPAQIGRQPGDHLETAGPVDTLAPLSWDFSDMPVSAMAFDNKLDTIAEAPFRFDFDFVEHSP